MNVEPVLSTRNLSLGYGRYPVVDVPDLTLHAGQKILVSGPSGSGKSLLLAALSGILPGSAVKHGEFWINRESEEKSCWTDYYEYRKHCGRDNRIGLLLQDTMQSLHPYRSVRQQFPNHLTGQEFAELLTEVKLSDRHMADDKVWRMPHQISGGERQRLALLLSGIRDKSVTFLDEPITDIDLISRKSVEASVNKIFASSENTVVIVTHDWDWLEGNYDHYSIEDDQLTRVKSVHRGATVIGDTTKHERLVPVMEKNANGKEQSVLEATIRTPFTVGGFGFQLLPLQLNLAVGKCVGVLGESGCGKSSLIRALVGLQRSQVYRDSVDLNLSIKQEMRPLAEIAPKTRAGYIQLVHQDTTGTLIENETIERHLERIFRRKRDVNKGEFDRLARAFAADLGLTGGSTQQKNPTANAQQDFFSKSFSQLSMGMRRRASLLRTYMLFNIFQEAAIKLPKILFVDEISRGLDSANRVLMAKSLLTFSNTYNVAIVAISHDVNFLRMFCDEFRLMFKGAVLPRRLTKNDITKFCSTEGALLSSNPYYHQFFNQIDKGDLTGISEKTVDFGLAGCLFDRVRGCDHNGAGNCEYDRELKVSGALGICE